jgi:hypothetical protein
MVVVVPSLFILFHPGFVSKYFTRADLQNNNSLGIFLSGMRISNSISKPISRAG